jgi:hypothetical protein
MTFPPATDLQFCNGTDGVPPFGREGAAQAVTRPGRRHRDRVGGQGVGKVALAEGDLRR